MTDRSKQAFPLPGSLPHERLGEQVGMTLREHYAGLAMQGILAGRFASGENFPSEKSVADWAVGYADKLIETLGEI